MSSSSNPDSPPIDHRVGSTKEKDQPVDQDQAYDFLRDAAVNQAELASFDLRRLRQRIDWHILPIMFCCYCLSFLDKVILNYGAVMGLKRDLGIATGNGFSNVGTFTFVALLVAEVPNGLILNRVPAGKWLGINVFFWGISTACVAATHNYTGLLIARIFLGIFEAAIGPCLILISSQYYTRAEQPARFAFWYTGLGAGQIIGSLVSFGFQHATTSHFAAWRIMFLTLGLVTIVVGAITFFVVPDSPMSARWLSEQEKSALLRHIAVNKTGVANYHFAPRQLLDLLLDPQNYIQMLMLLLLSVAAGVTTFYSATLLANVGFNPKQAAVLNAPGGVIAIVATLIGGYGVRYAKGRWAWIPACAAPAIIGAALMSFRQTKAGVLAGVWLVNTNVATLPIIYQWVAANNAGHTKRPLAMALIAGAFNVGNIIGPQTFQARDAPVYRPAKIALLAVLSAGAACAPLLALYYRFVNSQRDKRHGIPNKELPSDSEAWSNITDRENSSFRYVY